MSHSEHSQCLIASILRHWALLQMACQYWLLKCFRTLTRRTPGCLTPCGATSYATRCFSGNVGFRRPCDRIREQNAAKVYAIAHGARKPPSGNRRSASGHRDRTSPLWRFRHDRRHSKEKNTINFPHPHTPEPGRLPGPPVSRLLCRPQNSRRRIAKGAPERHRPQLPRAEIAPPSVSSNGLTLLKNRLSAKLYSGRRDIRCPRKPHSTEQFSRSP